MTSRLYWSLMSTIAVALLVNAIANWLKPPTAMLLSFAIMAILTAAYSLRSRPLIAVLVSLAILGIFAAAYLQISIRGDHEPSAHKMRVQLWPDPSDQQFGKRFIKDKDISLVLTIPGKDQLNFTDFRVGPNAQWLEAERDVVDPLFEATSEAIVTPRQKYRLLSYPEPQRVKLVSFVVMTVLPQGKQPIFPRIGTTAFLKEPAQLSADVPENTLATVVNARSGAVVAVQRGKASALVLEGKSFSLGSVVEWRSQSGLLSVSPSPWSKGIGWLGNEVGSANGKPLAVSTDGKQLVILGSPNESAHGDGRLVVTNENGTQLEYAVKFAKHDP